MSQPNRRPLQHLHSVILLTVSPLNDLMSFHSSYAFWWSDTFSFINQHTA